MARIILLAFRRVDEVGGELVAVVGVVTAAAPLPVVTRRRHRHGVGLDPSMHLFVCRLLTTAATRRDTTLTTRATDAVHDACRQRRVHQRRLPASCINNEGILARTEVHKDNNSSCVRKFLHSTVRQECRALSL